MAQERARRTGGLAGRLGLTGRVGVAVALVAVLVAMGVVAALGAGEGSVTVERAPEADARAEGTEADAAAAPPAASVTVFVHVDGSVAAPGVYELAEGSRVVDAVSAAGGLVEGADTSSLNLAAPVTDGEKVHVPVEGETAPPVAPDRQGDQAVAAAGAPPGAPATSAPVNLNTATVDELCGLPGIGRATAEAIVEDRASNGPFSSVEDLMRVSGIGKKKLAKLVGKVRV